MNWSLLRFRRYWLVFSYVVLPFADEASDIAAAVALFDDGHTNLGTATLVLIFVPAILELFSQLLTIKYRVLYQGRRQDEDEGYNCTTEFCVCVIFRAIAALPFINQICRAMIVYFCTCDEGVKTPEEIEEDQANQGCCCQIFCPNCCATKTFTEFRDAQLQRLALLEGMGESAPQFILQLSILIRYGFTSGSASGKQIFSIAISYISLVKMVLACCYKAQEEEGSWMKAGMASLVTSIGTLFKLGLCTLIVAFVRIYSLAFIAVNAIILALAACFLKGVGKWDFIVALFSNVVFAPSMSHNVIGIIQWTLMALNLATLGFVEGMIQPFAEDLPAIQEYFWPIFAGTSTGVLLITLPLEIASHFRFKDNWISMANVLKDKEMQNK